MSIESPQFGLVGNEQNEPELENIETPVNEGVERALSVVRQRFEETPEANDKLDFHNVAHTQGVIRRTETILSTIYETDSSLVHERDIALARLAAAHHDTVQQWEPNETNEGAFIKRTRRRFVGTNEKASAGEALAFMDEVNSRGKTLFSDSDKQTVQAAIAATIPGWDPEHKTVVQPKLTEQSPITARAVALADIGVAGMEGGGAYLREGNALFREENLDIREAVKKYGIAQIPEDQQAYFRTRMVNWQKGQVTFARGRQARLETELAALPETARERVKSLFDKFDETITAQEKAAQEAETMDFAQLAQAMGY